MTKLSKFLYNILKVKICTIGGGSGMPIINKGLIAAGFKSISSIVTTFDSGGDTGRLRTDERGNLLAFSDYWRALISLWQDGQQKTVWEEMLRYRDGRGRVFGNSFFRFMAEKLGDLGKVDELFAQLTGAKLRGKVIPVSLSPANICFRTQSGKTYQGEHLLDQLRMSRDLVKKIWLKPRVKANPEAIKAVMDAEVIIIAPGSVYGSILANFLPIGMGKAYRQSKAQKIVFANTMSVANENLRNENDYQKTFSLYLKTSRPFDKIIFADFNRLDRKMAQKIFSFYRLENSFPVVPLKTSRQVIVADIISIERTNLRFRHDPEKLAKFFKKTSQFREPKAN